MSKPKIIQIGSLGGSPGADNALREHFDVLPLWQAADRDQALRDAADVEVVVTSAMHGCKADVIEKLPNLKLICNWGVGYDSIDIETAAKHGVAVTNTPDVLNDCVADEAWGLIIACARHIPQGDRFVRDNRWENHDGMLPLGTRVSGKKLGIVGLGRIGMAIAKRAQGFDMQIGYHNRNARTDVPYTYMEKLTDLASWSDFLVVATVGGASTRKLISRDVLKALGPTSYIINIARGPVIDEAAMVELLQSGELGGAGLDVFENEPKVPDALKRLENVVLMPHVGSATTETRQAMFDVVMKNLQAYFAGKALLTPVATS
ncbi:MAG: 2-hydroxyacid dehydrogenase [Burkholderiaceae bacterium]|nr:2-hydroxyacid dehydrogenase [Burkholderiaceae bacterium]MCD8516714.1 2-hydroxyacid dehydrogenase [Burkholderiaceae bacterium]MCD8536610.1 2-hydroxyacid dehydrogenase [Burkholderiaceae bacterium]MCD8565150.1 2-hydroxyacid dehydrogenase [Burkholderiaceae bacterium]